MRRVLLILAALAFVACVAVQFNYPDPERWIAVYGAAAAACVLEALGQRRPILPWGLIGVSVLWTGALALGVDAAALERGFGDEVLREIGGLVLVGGVMGAMLATRKAPDVRGEGTCGCSSSAGPASAGRSSPRRPGTRGTP
jgi:hypothetical protein